MSVGDAIHCFFQLFSFFLKYWAEEDRDTQNEGENGSDLRFCGAMLLDAPLVLNAYLIPVEYHPCCLCRRSGISCSSTFACSLYVLHAVHA